MRMLNLLEDINERLRQGEIAQSEARRERYQIWRESRLRLDRCREDDAVDVAAAELAVLRARQEIIEGKLKEHRDRTPKRVKKRKQGRTKYVKTESGFVIAKGPLLILLRSGAVTVWSFAKLRTETRPKMYTGA